MISLRNVSYSYGPKPFARGWALQNVSLDIAGGEFLAVMGQNASGKSTLARLLNGLYVPNIGQVEVDGINTMDQSSRQQVKQLVGLMLAGADRQFVSNVVEEDLAFGPENLGLPANQIRIRVDAALKMVSMEEFAKHPPYLLSGGQKAKMALAGLLAMSPRYLVLDEPFSYLDTRCAAEVMEIILRVRADRGSALILITHDLESARKADRIAVLNEGQICFCGPPAELISHDNHVLRGWGFEPTETSLLAEQINQRVGSPIIGNIQHSDRLVEMLCQLS